MSHHSDEKKSWKQNFSPDNLDKKSESYKFHTNLGWIE